MSMETAESQRINVIRGRVPPDELSLFDHLRVLVKYRRMICLVCTIAVLAVGLISFAMPPMYVAKASIVPPTETMASDASLGVGLLGGSGASLLRKVMDVSSVADMYVGILQSRVATDAIIDRFDLMRVYEVGSSRYRARRILQRRTSLDVSEDAILYVAVEDRDRDRAAAIANAYVEELDHLNKKLLAGRSTGKRIFLETRLRDMEANLSRQDIPSREEQVQEMLYELLMRELEIAKIEEAKSMPTIQVLDSAVPPERRKARRTIVKAMLSGIIAFVCMVFVAFGREYARECRAREAMASAPVLETSGPTGAMEEREDGNRPVTSVSGRRAHTDERVTETMGSAQHV